VIPCAGPERRARFLRLFAAISGSVLLLPPMVCAQTQSLEPPSATGVVDDTAKIDAEFLGGDLQGNMPDIGVEWPDLAAPLNAPVPDQAAPATEGPPQQVATPAPAPDTGGPVAEEVIADDGSEHRYSVIVNGLDKIADDQFRSRFDELSLLAEGKGKPANIAQINRRMQQDALVLNSLMASKGYHDALIRQRVAPADAGSDGRPTVIFDIIPGQQFLLSRVSVNSLADIELKIPAIRNSFPVDVNDPLDAERILAAQQQLISTLGENGFPFARVEEPEVAVDYEARRGELDMIVASGGYRVFGSMIIKPTVKPMFSAKHLQRLARFDPGSPYSASAVDDLRRAIVTTGLVSSVKIQPVDAGDDQHVNLDVAVEPGPMHTIAGEAGYGTGEGYRVAASWQHRNFFPPEGAVTVRALAGTKEQLLGLSYRRNNFIRRDQLLTGAVTAQHVVYDAYTARTFTLAAGLERQTNIIFQKKWVWGLGTEFIVTREKDVFGAGVARSTRNYFIAALPLNLNYDGSDDLLNPTRGFRLGARVSPELSTQSGPFQYVRAQVDVSGYVPVSNKLVFASRVRAGSITGENVQRIAPSRRFYSGGGASVRGYSYQGLGPKDAANDPEGGKSLIEFSLEARVRFGNIGVVPFIDAGNISSKFLPRFKDMRFGTGIGLRYYSSFGPVRVDIGTPLQRKVGESRLAVYVSLGQAF
jgi:translocation and assembly module TamA